VTNAPRVLVVDGLAETETVLRAVLEPQGAAVERRRSAEGALSESMPPQVMIVDLDDEANHDASWPDVPRVMLGSVRMADDFHARFLEKPFHYPELVRMVQSLLDLPTEDRRVM
jgi:CheY-like chemotaxis protein